MSKVTPFFPVSTTQAYELTCGGLPDPDVNNAYRDVFRAHKELGMSRADLVGDRTGKYNDVFRSYARLVPEMRRYAEGVVFTTLETVEPGLYRDVTHDYYPDRSELYKNTFTERYLLVKGCFT